jgi:cell division protein ZipA
MQANWSLILNVLLLISVIAAIGRLMKMKKQSRGSESSSPSFGQQVESPPADFRSDDIIAVRKLNISPSLTANVEIDLASLTPSTTSSLESRPVLVKEDSAISKADDGKRSPNLIMVFLAAKEKKQFAGYELLQSLLAAGLRFGEGNLFHRHQFANGQGPILCSLAAATATGVFDLQNIGIFSVRALCLFMHASQNTTIDEERFKLMLETANQLCEGMDAHLLDNQRRPFTSESLIHYRRLLGIEEVSLPS